MLSGSLSAPADLLPAGAEELEACLKNEVGLNGFAEEKRCIAKRSDREYPFVGWRRPAGSMLQRRETSMTPLRARMIEDMTLAGLAAGTQAIYIQAVRRLAAHYRRSPDQLSEEEVRAYLLALRERGVALGTFKTNHGGIQFLYSPDAGPRLAAVWEKKIRLPRQKRLPQRPVRCPGPRPARRASATRSTRPASPLMYACGLRISEAATPGGHRDRQRQLASCASSARATRNGGCRCHSRCLTTCAASGEHTAIRAGSSPIAADRSGQHSMSCAAPSGPPPGRPASRTGSRRIRCATAMRPGSSRSGVDTRVVQILLGHENIATTPSTPT